MTALANFSLGNILPYFSLKCCLEFREHTYGGLNAFWNLQRGRGFKYGSRPCLGTDICWNHSFHAAQSINFFLQYHTLIGFEMETLMAQK